MCTYIYIYIYKIKNQKKNVNIGIDCNLLNTLQLISTSHSIPHATLFWWWQNQRNTKFYSVRTSKYYSGTFPYYKVPHRTQKYRKGLNCSPFDSHSTWNVQYIARSNLCDAKHNRITTFMFDSRNTWTSFTLGGATYGMQNTTDLRHSVSQSQHMKRQLHCAEQPLGMQNAMEQWHSCLKNLHCAEYQKSPFQLQQILRLPRQMTLMICPRRTSVQMTLLIGLHHTSKRSSTMRRASGVTKYFPCQENTIPKYERYLQTMAETSFTVRGRSDHDPTTIRAWTGQHTKFYQILLRHKKWRLNFTK